jgi:hypothetical protein
MLFDHDAKVSGDFARFADLPGGLGAVCVPVKEPPGAPGILRGMATTLTAMLFTGDRAALAHR